MILVSANRNEKKHSIGLFGEASEYAKPGKLLVDSQYSSANFRECILEHGALPVIPYPRNQQKGVKGTLRLTGNFAVTDLNPSRELKGKGLLWNEFSADSRIW